MEFTSDTDTTLVNQTLSRNTELFPSTTPSAKCVSIITRNLLFSELLQFEFFSYFFLVWEMGSRHKVTKESISILKTCTMSFKQCRIRNPRSRKWANSGTLAVPHWETRVRPTDKQYQSRFNKNRPAMFKTGTSIDE